MREAATVAACTDARDHSSLASTAAGFSAARPVLAICTNPALRASSHPAICSAFFAAASRPGDA